MIVAFYLIKFMLIINNENEWFTNCTHKLKVDTGAICNVLSIDYIKKKVL